MVLVHDDYAQRGRPAFRPQDAHPRSKSSVLRSFLHRRNRSEGDALPTLDLTPGTPSDSNPMDSNPTREARPRDGNGVLGEVKQARSPRPHAGDRTRDPVPGSPTKKATGLGLGLRPGPVTILDESGRQDLRKGSDRSSPQKKKPSAGLAGFLSRPKSSKNLRTLALEEDLRAGVGNKENRVPRGPDGHLPQHQPLLPIYAQFCSEAVVSSRRQHLEQHTGRHDGRERPGERDGRDGTYTPTSPEKVLRLSKGDGEGGDKTHQLSKRAGESEHNRLRNRASQAIMSSSIKQQLARVVAGDGKAGDGEQAPSLMDSREIDRHLDEMLDRRNIPENQRFKMRSLTDAIKAELIRQDWAEMQAARLSDGAADSASAVSATAESPTAGPDLDLGGSLTDGEDKAVKSKRKRGMSFTLLRKPRAQASRTDFSLGRHFRTKSSESLTAERDRPPSAAAQQAGRSSQDRADGSGGGGGGGATSAGGVASRSGLLAKIKPQQSPADFVVYLRRVRRPQQVEMGRLHKLRILLRNETVSWTDEFVRHGGMEEVVGLLYRIIEVEWREEHEDALLHENLLCLKALCTTALALQHVHSIQADLFPRLLHLIFDPDKKGPSEFATRGIITSILFTYIASGPSTPSVPYPAGGTDHTAAALVPPRSSGSSTSASGYAGRCSRAAVVLSHLRDREQAEEKLPVLFVLEMRRERPYRMWCREMMGVTKEVFWIFLHHLNVVEHGKSRPAPVAAATDDDDAGYMARHFPQDRPPVPAAPYVGGVEWDATNYLASHLDLLNAIVACTPGGAAARNDLRASLRLSGWERCLGGTLRLCKEKFYGAVHDGLRTWVAAAAADGWDVDAVRFGPPAEPAARPGGAHKKSHMPAPRVELAGFESNWLG